MKKQKEFNMAEEEIGAVKEEEKPSADNAENSFLAKERYEIFYDQPLPEFNVNGALAYQVKDKVNPQKELFALICDNNFPPRLSVLPYLKSIDHPNILKLVEYGVVENIPQKSLNMALIYRKPGGPKVSSVLKEDDSAVKNVEKFKSLVLSLISATEAMRGYNITHRSIRLDNIFFKDASRNELVLGDCAASFPALYQPHAYETIESLLCLPQARGNGSNSDDMYAAGVCLLGLVLQTDFSSSVSAPELMHQKLKKTSFATLSNGKKINVQFLVVLKSLLEDSVEKRGGYLQIYNFLEGKANNFNVEASDRSMRALPLNNEKYYTAKSAAIAMLENPKEALAVIQNGKLLEWVKNGLENEKLHAKIEKLIKQSQEKDETALLVSEVCIFLDCSLPIRSGEIYLFPGGLPKAIFYYLKNNKNTSDFHTLLSSDLVKNWYQEQPSLRAPSNSSEFRAYISRNGYGYGIDRIMYDFDDDLPCTSELIGNEFVNSPAKLLRALDANYTKFKDVQPFDRNIIAYLRCKMGKKIDGIITDINSHQDYLQKSAIIRLYANIQNKHGPVQLFNLCQWLVNSAKPIIKSYHNLKYQKYLEQELVKIAKNGKIIDIYEILENDEAKNKDRNEYSEALKNINLLMNERNRILSGDARLDEEARDLALRFASVLSVLTMLSSFIFSLIYWAIK